jgi:hypothetical protein
LTSDQDEKIEQMKATLIEWLKKNGYKKTFQDGKKQKLSCIATDIDAVLALFSEFNA